METYKISDCIDIDFMDRNYDFDFNFDDRLLDDDNKWLGSGSDVAAPAAFRYREDTVRDGDQMALW